MHGRLLAILFLTVTLVAAGCSGPDDDAQAEVPSAVATEIQTPAVVPPTPTESASPSPTHTPTPTATREPIPTHDPTPTSSPSPTATSEPTATPTTAPEPTATSSVPTPPIPTPVPHEGFVTIHRAETAETIVALTFDAGADRGYAEQILDTLRDEGVAATFGMTGVWAEQHPDLIRRMVDEGHQIINHTYDHRSWTGTSSSPAVLTSDERAEELHRTEDIVRQITGRELAPYFRPPYGDFDDSCISDLEANGYSVNVMWTVDSLGWKGLSAEDITARVVAGTVPGAIHLFHVGAQSQDAAALPDIIHQLRNQGYRFVTVQEMVGR